MSRCQLKSSYDTSPLSLLWSSGSSLNPIYPAVPDTWLAERGKSHPDLRGTATLDLDLSWFQYNWRQWFTQSFLLCFLLFCYFQMYWGLLIFCLEKITRICKVAILNETSLLSSKCSAQIGISCQASSLEYFSLQLHDFQVMLYLVVVPRMSKTIDILANKVT